MEERMENYLQQCKELSLTARLAIALLIFEKYCKNHKLKDSLIDDLSDYLWKWPLIDGVEQFNSWEQSRPQLVNFGLGDEASDKLKSILEFSDVNQSAFRGIVSNIVEILWVSFWGAAEDDLSIQALSTVIKSSKLSILPPLTPFKFSQFCDGNGWGKKVFKEDCDFWRHSFE